VRVLFELEHRDRPTASDIATALNLDEGYLSRLLRRLRQHGLVRARTATHDGRQRRLALTAKGRKAFQSLSGKATDSVLSLIEHLTAPEQQELVSAVRSVEALLETPAERCTLADTVELRPPRPGDLGWVVMRHGELYDQEYGWNEEFERLVAGIVGGFATGLALYALGSAEDAAVPRARKFLVESQSPDGSWPIPPGPWSIPGSKPEGLKRREPIYRYWGTAWATIGLARTLP